MKKGLFFRVSKDGLCVKCEPMVIMIIRRNVEIYNESRKLVDETKNFKTKMGRLDIMKEKALELKRYELMEIIDTKPSTNQMLFDIENSKKEAIKEQADSQVTKYMDRALLAKTVSTKINNANKALLELKAIKDEYDYEDKIKAREILHFIEDSQIDDYVTKGDKADFKENHKRAIDHYLDALFHIKNINIPGYNKEEHSSFVQKKIEDIKNTNQIE